MPLPISPLLTAFLLLGLLGVLLTGREVLRRIHHALGPGASVEALAAGALAGAVLAPEPVASTLASDLVAAGAGGSAAGLVYGFLAALAVTLGFLAATPVGFGGFPFSVTQVTVGALVGAAAAVAGPATIGLPALAAAALAWLLVPPAAAITARRLARDPPGAAAWAALLVPAGLLLGAPWSLGLHPLAGVAAGGLAGALLAAPVASRAAWESPRAQAAAVAALGLAAGSSDVANVLAPTVAAVETLSAGAPVPFGSVPADVRLLTGGALVVGLVAWTPEALEAGPDHADEAAAGGLAALAGGAALPLALVTALGVPASATTALMGAAAGLRLDDEAPWRRIAAAGLLWFLLAALAAAFLAGALGNALV